MRAVKQKLGVCRIKHMESGTALYATHCSHRHCRRSPSGLLWFELALFWSQTPRFGIWFDVAA
jgi:hypothetical protein